MGMCMYSGKRTERAGKDGNYVQHEIWDQLEAALKEHRNTGTLGIPSLN